MSQNQEQTQPTQQIIDHVPGMPISGSEWGPVTLHGTEDLGMFDPKTVKELGDVGLAGVGTEPPRFVEQVNPFNRQASPDLSKRRPRPTIVRDAQ